MTLTAAEVGKYVDTIPAAISRLEALGEMLGTDEHDGLRYFNVLYLAVTSTIQERLEEKATPAYFLDTLFLSALDVAFANRYLDAVANCMDGRPVPGPWRVLFERRYDKGIHPVQFAAAGVNAHINFDLAQALVTAWQDCPRVEGDYQRHDYDQINNVFADLYQPLRMRLAAEIGPLDHGPVRRALNDASSVLVHHTRRWAWDNGEVFADGRDGGMVKAFRAAARLRMVTAAATETAAMLLQPLT